MTWPAPLPKERHNRQMSNSIASLIIMALITTALILTGAFLLNAEQLAAGWVLIVTGALAALVTLGQASKVGK